MFQSVSKFILCVLGWKMVGQLPNEKKFIIIIGPHTSNWDFILGMVVRGAMGANVRFLAKHQLFNAPYGWFFRWLGGSPVYRHKDNNLVDQVVAMYENHDEFILGIAPEGTRSEIKRWKSGFYHIACKANVPIEMIGFDFKSKEVRFREPFMPTGNIDVDFPVILDYFRSIDGRHPKNIPHHLPAEK
ncbi:lysophospholipid acyltransferase family protein [Psychrobium sp. nBUS_13]|uniref:lysophospholipid acyltransferase family protein n=1 Tax=Psychrobium sp. nBUS_13 TaxID=3395319 RepID=UPI003EBA5691